MWKRLVARVAGLAGHLTHAGEGEPLGKLALAIVLLLDAFVLGAIFEGLDQHTRQLAAPEDRVPYLCRTAVIARDWNATTRLERLADAVESRRGFIFQDERRPAPHPVCAPFLAAVDAASRDEALTRTLGHRAAIARELGEAREALSRVKGSYDTALLRTVAGKAGAPSGVAAIEQDVLARTASVEALTAKLAATDAELQAARPVAAVWAALAATRDADRDRLEADLRRLEFWHPLKVLGMQLLFLLPLLGVFYAWSAASLRRGRGVQTLVASHLLVVAAIPVLLRIADAVYDVLPKRLLRALIQLLERLQLVALWHYAVIAAAVVTGLLLVALVQLKLFSRKRLLERRIARALCQDCGRRLPAGARACPFCGMDQFRACPSCGGPMHVHAPFCQECGKAAA
ncbi:zinc ribbon domain-containing protein [Anaeromyxobacter oryzisoli]|uniref:zinc ribbon domain-containing protein n=1 Tax=Anaeromyxobacter oryzisoli TaxID=2925408 RepID=UPI001F598411|nr:zinc ribbon domain-containing protein [Anaeromyxobacter sp. SG63]